MKAVKGFVLVFLLGITSAHGQNPAIDLDGSGDISNSSVGSVIDGASGLTMMGWVNLQNPAPGFPNFDGVMGYRNEFDFDFFILHLNSTTFEARFRNSFGTAYTLSSATAVVNSWQHVALTYDGAELKFYYNGSLAASVPAFGAISAAGETFYGGVANFGVTPFRLDGQLDNIQLWDRALSESEIVDLHCREILDTADYPGLKLHWTMNEGSGMTTADAAGGHTGTLFGGASWTTTGANICELLSSSSEVTVCPGDSAEIFGNWQSSPDDYVDSFTTSLGYDSVVTVTLSNYPAPTVPVISMPDDSTLQCTAASSYQWYLDGSILSGETNQLLFDPVPGTYSVQTTDSNGCVALSDTFGVAEPPPPPSGIAPGTQASLLWVEGSLVKLNLTAEGVLSIYDLQGRIWLTQTFRAGTHTVDLAKKQAARSSAVLIAILNTNSGQLSLKFHLP